MNHRRREMTNRWITMTAWPLLIWAFMAMTLQAQDPESLAKEINSDLRKAQNLMFSGKFQEAATSAAEIQDKLDQLRSADPDHRQLASFQSKLDKLKKDLDRRLPKETAAPATPATPAKPAKPENGGSAPAPAAPAAQAASSPAAVKLPAGATRCIREMDRGLEKADRSLSRTSGSEKSKIDQARYEMKTVEMYWEDLQKKYPDSAGHAEAAAARERADEMYQRIEAAEQDLGASQAKAAQAQAAQAEASGDWLSKLEPYVAHRGEEAYNPDREFISGYSEDKTEMDQRMKLYAEASNALAQYRKADFPNGKTDRLEQVEKELSYRLETFKGELESESERHLAEIDRELARLKGFLAGNTGRDHPLLIDDGVLIRLSAQIDWVEGLRPGDGRLDGLNGRFDEIRKSQSDWRAKMIESTRMQPDRFSGGEGSAVKDKARQVVAGKFSDASVLRITVISEDWNEERALEFTDTTRSTVRYRVTRSVSAQVAARRGGDCFLYTVHVAKNRRSDGSWGSLNGHIMFTDRILEENVDD